MIVMVWFFSMTAGRSFPLLVAVVMVAWALLIAMALLWCVRRRRKQKAHAGGVGTLPLPTATADNNILNSAASCTREHLRHIKNAINTPAHRCHANNANATGRTQARGAERFQEPPPSYSLVGRHDLPPHPRLQSHQPPHPQTGKQDNREVEVGSIALLGPCVAAGPQHV